MWAWFYLPDRLPRAYNKWIGEAAQVDYRLISVLRKAHAGEFIYGEDTGQAHILQDMCSDYGWPLAWADPVKTIPIPCEIVHMGTGPSCRKSYFLLNEFFFCGLILNPETCLGRFRSSDTSRSSLVSLKREILTSKLIRLARCCTVFADVPFRFGDESAASVVSQSEDPIFQGIWKGV